MADEAIQKTKSLRPFDSRPSASSAPKGGGYLGGKAKSGRSKGGLEFGKKKSSTGVQV